MPTASAQTWDHTVDLIVVGAGGGGMTAALAAADRGLDVLVVEKAATYGGTTALSGGAIWVPNNMHMDAVGVADSADHAATYLHAAVGDRVPAERLDAYLHWAPRMVAELHERSPVRFQAVAEYADYYPELPGSKPGARTLEAVPFDTDELAGHAPRLRPPHPQELIMGRVAATAAEARVLLQGGWRGNLLALKLLLRYWLNLPARLRGRRDRRLCLGNALMGRLRRALLDRGVPLWLDTPAEALVQDEGGAVTGLVVRRGGRRLHLRAHRGVVLAAGGFAKHADMRRSHQPAPIGADWTAAIAEDTGDAIAMGQAAGAATDLLDDAWWTPTFRVPGSDVPWLLVVEKSLPGCILVDRRGRRFTNEAAPYIDVVADMYKDEAAAVPAFLIMDQRFRHRYPLGPLLPQAVQPHWAQPRHLRNWVQRSRSLPGLAGKLGIDPAGLAATVERFNAQAARGDDPDFHKGANRYDRYYGDPAVQPNPCLAPLVQPPFYGLQVNPGDLGTKGGLVTDARARVLDEAGAAIPGLYATGNCSASVMGHTYPGAGSTIGPAMTFGYVAALDAAGEFAAADRPPASAVA